MLRYTCGDGGEVIVEVGAVPVFKFYKIAHAAGVAEQARIKFQPRDRTIGNSSLMEAV